MASEVLAEAEILPEDIDRISVCTGPGSFTGLRVALAFAKGFALPRNIPVIGLSSLEVLAAQADPQRRLRIVSAADVRRGQLCWALFEAGEQIRPPMTQDVETARAEIEALGYDRLVGDGAGHVDEASTMITVSGPILAWLAENRNPMDYPATPLYSRPPDAKLPGGITPEHLRS